MAFSQIFCLNNLVCPLKNRQTKQTNILQWCPTQHVEIKQHNQRLPDKLAKQPLNSVFLKQIDMFYCQPLIRATTRWRGWLTLLCVALISRPLCILTHKSNTNQHKVTSLLKKKFTGLGTGSNPDLHRTHQARQIATMKTARLGEMSPARQLCSGPHRLPACLRKYCVWRRSRRICSVGRRQEVALSVGLTNDFRVIPLIILAWARRRRRVRGQPNSGVPPSPVGEGGPVWGGGCLTSESPHVPHPSPSLPPLPGQQ